MTVPVPFDRMIVALEALAEPTRLRLAALLSEAELTVTELTSILGQSQPRVSRHLKLMVEADLIERHREGAWAFFRLADASAGVDGQPDHPAARPGGSRSLPATARVSPKRARRAPLMPHNILRARRSTWDKIRASCISAMPGWSRRSPNSSARSPSMRFSISAPARAGCWRCWPRSRPGPSASTKAPAMLSVARCNLERVGIRNVQLRQGDIYALPVERAAYDLVIVHQVLHFLDDPARAIREAVRTLAPGGRLAIVDFAPHAEETSAHAACASPPRLRAWRDRGLHGRSGRADRPSSAISSPGVGTSARLTVSIWLGRDQRIQGDMGADLSRVA